MTQNENELLLKDLCARLPYGVKVYDIKSDINSSFMNLNHVNGTVREVFISYMHKCRTAPIEDVKPYLFPLSSMTDEDFAIYFKIWEDAGQMAYLEGCHPLIINIKAYKAAIDYLLSKHYDINGLIPMGLAIDATGLNIY